MLSNGNSDDILHNKVRDVFAFLGFISIKATEYPDSARLSGFAVEYRHISR